MMDTAEVYLESLLKAPLLIQPRKDEKENNRAIHQDLYIPLTKRYMQFRRNHFLQTDDNKNRFSHLGMNPVGSVTGGQGHSIVNGEGDLYFTAKIQMRAVPHYNDESLKYWNKHLPKLPIDFSPNDSLALLSTIFLHELGHLYHFSFFNLYNGRNPRNSVGLYGPCKVKEFHADHGLYCFLSQTNALDAYRDWIPSAEEDPLNSFDDFDINLAESFRLTECAWSAKYSREVDIRERERKQHTR